MGDYTFMLHKIVNTIFNFPTEELMKLKALSFVGDHVFRHLVLNNEG